MKGQKYKNSTLRAKRKKSKENNNDLKNTRELTLILFVSIFIVT